MSNIAGHDARGRRDIQRFVRNLRAWYRGAARDLPWRGTTDPYRILVSEMMLQQTTVAAVVPRFLAWIECFPDMEALAAAGEQEVLHAWRGLGYYARARRLHEAARSIAFERGGVWPRTAEELRRLPGIGSYTASAVAAFAFGEPVAVVDANVVRVVSRLDAVGEPVDTAAGRAVIGAGADALLDRRRSALHNNAMMELGATVCLPRKPLCHACPVAAHCRAAPGNPEHFPIKKPRAKATAVACRHAFISGRRGILLEQQQGPRWRGLWTLPAAELPGITVDPSSKPLHRLVHPITRYRVTMDVHAARAPRRLPATCRWWPLDALASCPMPSPHRRALAALLGMRVKGVRRQPPR